MCIGYDRVEMTYRALALAVYLLREMYSNSCSLSRRSIGSLVVLHMRMPDCERKAKCTRIETYLSNVLKHHRSSSETNLPILLLDED